MTEPTPSSERAEGIRRQPVEGKVATERMSTPVTGLACGGGGALAVERLLLRLPGVTSVYVNPANERAYVDFDPSVCTPGLVRSRLVEAGLLPREAL